MMEDGLPPEDGCCEICGAIGCQVYCFQCRTLMEGKPKKMVDDKPETKENEDEG